LVTQTQRIFGYRLVKLGAGGTTLFGEHRFVAAEGPQPIARGCLGRGDAQISEQIAEGAAPPERDAGYRRSGLEKMYVRIDKPGGNSPPRKLHQVGSRTDARFQPCKRSEVDDPSGGNRHRITAKPAKDLPLVKNQIGFDRLTGHTQPAAAAKSRPAGSLSVRGRQRLRFLDLHLAFTTLQGTRTRLVAEHLGAALFAQVAFAKHVCHFSYLSLALQSKTTRLLYFKPCGNGMSETSASRSPAISAMVSRVPGFHTL